MIKSKSQKLQLVGLLLVSSLMPACASTTLANNSPLTTAVNESTTITGQVVNDENEPLIGVIVSNSEGYNAVTDVDGRFSIVSEKGEMLHFVYVGYQTIDVKASKDMKVTMQEDTQVLGEVVVTTQKRRQTSIEVPVAVSALSGNVIEHLNLQQMDQMAAYIPGLQVQVQSPNMSSYSIRGVTSDASESYAEPRVSVYVDGVPNTRRQPSVTEIFDMERIEVVKGPQGTLFGRSAEVGAMHFLRNKPTNTLSGELQLNYGTHNQRGAEGFINTPLSSKLFNRFAFSYDAHDGYIKNQAGGRLNGKSAIALRNSTRLFAGDDTKMDLVLDYQHDAYPGTDFKGNLLAPPYGGDTSPYTEAYLNGGKDLTMKRHTGGAAFILEHKISPALTLNSITGFRAFKSHELFDADGTYLHLLDCEENVKGTQFSQELRLNWDNGGKLSGFIGTSYFYEHAQQELITKTNLQYTYPMAVAPMLKNSTEFSTLPTEVASGVAGGIDDMVNGLKTDYPDYADVIDEYLGGLSSSINTELTEKLTGVKDSWFDAEMWKTTPDFYGDTNNAVSEVLTNTLTNLFNQHPEAAELLGGASVSDIVGSVSSEVASSLKEMGLDAYSNLALSEEDEENNTNYSTNQSADIFADATWHIYKGLSLTAGLRGTYEHQKSGYKSTSDILPLIDCALMYQPTNGLTYHACNKYWSWVGRMALNYMFHRNNAYVSISRGRQPGMVYFNNDATDIKKLKPEIIINYEAGIKGLVLDNRLSYDFSVFYYNWNHFQSSRWTLTESGTHEYVTSDAGKAHTFGIEAAIRYSLTSHVNVFANYAYIDGKFNAKDGDGYEQELAGNRFRLTPKHSFALGLDVNVPVNKRTLLYLRPNYSYKTRVYFEDDNTEELSQGSYGLFNANLGLQQKCGSFYYEIGLFGKNIFNKEYLVDAGNSGNTIGAPTFIPGAPSVFGVQFKIGF